MPRFMDKPTHRGNGSCNVCDVVTNLSWQQRSLDPCIFIKRNGDIPVAVLGIHVDDVRQQSWNQDVIITKVTLSQFGSLEWMAGATRPDIAADVSLLQKSMDELKHQGLIEAKAVLKYVKATASSFIVMKPVDTEKMVIVTFGDAAFANAPSNKSQGGYVTVACTEDSLQGEGDASLLDWKSYWHQRVLRSTLAAEAASLDRAEDGANFVSAFTGELFLPGYVASRSGKSLFPIWPVTHARSLYDAIHRLATSFAEKRVEIDIAALRQCCRSLRWVPTEVMLADGFTKRSRALRDKLRRWQEDPKISLTEARDAHDEDVQGPWRSQA
ncbi:Copia protein [Durusdinium trenchii]|uniref:Copia protein n=1 Tax=Durusdinium trenchii TaxID=1381693 RepID=A0ABP0JGW8_9DINO